jgi:signal transduction histidine kinase
MLVAAALLLYVEINSPALRSAGVLLLSEISAGLLLVGSVVAWRYLPLVVEPAQLWWFRIGGMLADTLLVAFATLGIATAQPASLLGWAFLLWVPWSAGHRFTAKSAGVAVVMSMFVAISVIVVSRGITSIGQVSLASVVPPLVFVLCAGAAGVLAGVAFQRDASRVRRKLDAEKARALDLLAADEQKNLMLAAVSHDLRTPLTSILGFAVTLLDHPNLPAGERTAMLQTIVSEAEQLDDILANLLDLDRLTRGKVTLVRSNTNVSELVSLAASRVAKRSGRAIRVETKSAVFGSIDTAKVDRIVENLVANAIKHTADDVTIEIRTTELGGGVRIEVIDGGDGIDPGLCESIFDAFQRGDTSAAGSGLGLAIVDEFARMHHGSVRLLSAQPSGCRFIVDLPAQSSAEFDGFGSGPVPGTVKTQGADAAQPPGSPAKEFA